MTVLTSSAGNGAIALPQAHLDYWPAWLDRAEADTRLADLMTSLPWQVYRIRMFGRIVDSPRLSCWMGDPQARYRYSGTDFVPHPWHPPLLAMAQRLQRELGVPFNSVLANRYRSGQDAMGWHSDDEPELGVEPVIASVSLGAARRFALKHRQDPALRTSLELGHGSLLVMAGGTQQHYRHALPRTAKPVGERINLTFRNIRPR